MPDLLSPELLRTFEHRHSDGSWERMEQSAHDPAALDPEAGWADGVVFVCRTCDEQVRIGHREDADPKP